MYLTGNRCLTFNELMTMKKIYSFIVAAVAILATAACTQELENVAPEATGETVVYTASMDDVASKALLDETTNKPEWEANDAITVHDGTKGWTFTTATAGDNVEFSNSEGFGSYRPVLAVYPAGEYNTVDVANKTVKANIPTYQQAKVNTYNPAAALAVAYTESNSFAFKNAHALLKFTVNTDNVTHVVFHGNNAEALTGDVNVTLGAEGVETVECRETVFTSEQWNEELQQNETVSETKYGTWVECYAYQDAENKYFVKGETYYIAVAPQIFNGGVTVKFRIDEGDELTVKTTTNKVETKASVILDLGELGGVEYTAPATVETVYLKPDVWAADGAWFNAHFFNPVGGVIDVKMDGPDADGMYSATVPENVDKVIFCRMNPEYTEFGWDVTEGENVTEDHVWNQTGDLTIPLEGDDKFYYVISDWAAGEWKNYEDATTEPVVYEWTVAGTCNGWNITATPMTLEGDYSVAKGVVFEAEGLFKIVNNGTDWYSVSDTFTTNKWMTLTGGEDVSIPAGTYDFYISGSSLQVVPTGSSAPLAPGVIPVEEGWVYLKPNSNWTQASARFAIYFFGAGETWVDMALIEGTSYYGVKISDIISSGYTGMIFCRMNPSNATNSWDYKWNQTGDLTVSTFTSGSNCFTVPSGSWDGATTGWSTITQLN